MPRVCQFRQSMSAFFTSSHRHCANWVAPRGERSELAVYAADAALALLPRLYAVLLAITAQATRAILLASATATTLNGYFASSLRRCPQTIGWLSDNGPGYIAHDTKSLAREMGLEPRTTPVQSPQSNGMAEAFVRTIKRDYVRVCPIPDARTVLESLPLWFEHFNSLHPHKALGYCSPREFIPSRQPG